jgi:hypothetical protein
MTRRKRSLENLWKKMRKMIQRRISQMWRIKTKRRKRRRKKLPIPTQ